MQLEYTGVLYALSFALDAVEREVNGAEEGHEMRVGWLSYCLARGLGYTNEETGDDGLHGHSNGRGRKSCIPWTCSI